MRNFLLATLVLCTGCAGSVLKSIKSGTPSAGELACEGEVAPAPGVHALRSQCKTIAEWTDAESCQIAEASTGVAAADCLADVKDVRPAGPTVFQPVIGGFRPTQTPGLFSSPKRLVRIYDEPTLTRKFGAILTMRELGEAMLARKLEPKQVTAALADQLQEDAESRFFFARRVTQLNNLALDQLTGPAVETAAAELWLSTRLSMHLTEASKFDVERQLKRLPQGKEELTRLANTPEAELYALLKSRPPLPELPNRLPETEQPPPPETGTMQLKPAAQPVAPTPAPVK